MYFGPPVDDPEVLRALPPELRHLLERANGYVAYHGGLHVRGACRTPEWHALRSAWEGADAIHRLYPAVDPDDIPFAEDALGDQYLLRNRAVFRLLAETGETESLGLDLVEFDTAVRADPVTSLSLAPLEEFRAQGGSLEPGQLLNAYPPFVLNPDAAGVSYRAIPALEQRRHLAELARQLRDLPDGTPVRLIPLE